MFYKKLNNIYGYNEYKFKPRSKKELIDALKQDKYLIDIIKDLQITENEMLENYIEFKDYVEECKLDDNLKVFKTEIKRDKRNKLVFIPIILKNENARKFLLENNLAFSNISRPIHKFTVQDIKKVPKNTSLYEIKTQILNNLKNKNNSCVNCFIYGEFESKRSEILSAIANTYLLENMKVAYLNVGYLEDTLKNTFNSTFNETSYIINNLMNIDVLVLDELGFKKYSPWFIETVLIKILENRLINHKITFIGSYFPYNNLEQIINSNNRQTNFVIPKLIAIIDKLCYHKFQITK